MSYWADDRALYWEQRRLDAAQEAAKRRMDAEKERKERGDEDHD